MKTLPPFLIIAFAWVSGLANDGIHVLNNPATFSENQIIIDCPEVTCNAATSFQGMLSNTGTSSGGPFPVTGVMLYIDFASGMSVVDLNISKGEVVMQTDEMIAIDVGMMDAKEVIDFDFVINPISTGNFVNLQLIQNEFNPGSANEFKCNMEFVPCADLKLTKSTNNSIYKIDQPFNFDFKVENLGPDISENVVVYDDFFSPFELIEFPDFCSLNTNDNALTCMLGDIVPGDSKSFSVETKVEFVYENTNRAEVFSDTYDPVASNNTSSAMVSIEDSSIDLEVSITADKNPISVGKDINYTLKVKNKGAGDAEGVKLTNLLPSFLGVAGTRSFHLSIITPPPGCSVSASEIVCEIPLLASGEEKTFNYLAYATAARNLSNYAEAFAESPEEEFLGNNFGQSDVHVRGDYTSNGGNEDEVYAADPVSVYTGEYFFSEFEDVIQFGIMNLVFDRYYASRLHNEQYSIGRLGKNWSHNYDWRLVKDEEGYVEIHNYKGKVFVFEENDGDWSITNHPSKFRLVSEAGQYHFGDLENQSIYSFNQDGQLIEVSILNGLGVRLSYEGDALSQIEDSFGRQLDFTYKEGLISSNTNGVQTSTYEYADGLLISCILGNGKKITYTYDDMNEESGLLTQRMDYDDSVSLLIQEYGNAGQVTSQTDILGNEYAFVYDALKTAFIDPSSKETIYTFDSLGAVNRITNPRGFSTDVILEFGNHRKTEDALGLPFDQFYSSENGLSEKFVINDDEATVSYEEVNVKGISFYLPASIIYPDGAAKIFSYDESGNIIKILALGGDIVEFQYTELSLLSEIFINDLPIYAYEYDELGNMIKISDFEGSEFLFEYDLLGRRTKISTPEQEYQRFSYNSSHLPISIVEGEDEIKIDYTSFDKVSKVTFPDETLITYLYDAMRRQTGWIDTQGDSILFDLDYAGNISSIKEREQTQIKVGYDQNFNVNSLRRNELDYTFEYNENDHLVGYTFPGGKTIDAEVRTDGLVSSYKVDGVNAGFYQYDDNNRLNGITYPSGREQSIVRASNGAVEKTILSGEVMASFEAIGLNKYTQITDPNGGVWKTEYRSDLLPSKAINPIGEELDYEYDHLKRLIKIQGATKNTTISYGSNNMPEMFSFSDGDHITLQYDLMNRMTKSKAFEVSYDHNGNIITSNGIVTLRDKEGRITQIKYDDSFEVTYSYDALGQLIKISDSRGNEYSFDFYENQLSKSIERSNNTRTAFEYNSFNQVSRISEENASTSSIIALSYDEDGKLVQVSKTGGFYPLIETNAESNGYNPAHQIAGVTYDEAGNALSTEIAEIEWNDAGELVKVSRDGNVQNYQYDVFSNRVADNVGGNSMSYTINYALGKVQIAVMQSESEKSYLVSDPDGLLLYQVDSVSGEAKHYHFDERDNTSFITNQSGSIIQEYAYSPFGDITERDQDVINKFTFLGRWGVIWDKEFQLLQMHKRFYDQQSRRFLSRDQDFDRMDPRLINPYVYSPQDPINYIDPFGNTPTESQENDLHLDGNGLVGTSLFAGGSFATGLPTGFQAPKLPDFSGGTIKGVYDFIAGSPGAPESFSKSGKLLEKAREAAQTGQAAGHYGLTDIKKSQTQLALENGKKASKWKSAGKAFNAAGNVLTVVNVGVSLNKSRENINGAENRAVDNINSSASTFSVQTNNLIQLFKQGKMSKAEFNRRFRIMLATNNSSISASNMIFLSEISFEGTDGLLKGLEAMLPNPTDLSLSEGVYGLFGYSSNSFRQ